MIEFIDNQTVKFTQEGEEDTCGCIGQPYCQPVRFTDETEFQVRGDIVNSDPTFGSSSVAWEKWRAISLDIDFAGISAEGECDGEITVNASSGSGGYEYKIDDGAFGGSNVFTELCEGVYLITVIDSDGHYVSQYVTIGLAADCSSFNGSDANDVLSIYSNDILNCYANDFI